MRSDRRVRDAAATREALLAAARPLFSEQGYEATTVSQIARAAGFSPNLVTRYFGGKEGLFLAATRTSLGMERMLTVDAAEFGHRLAEQIVDRWEQQGQSDPLLMMLRSASPRSAALETLGEFLEREATAPLTRALRGMGLSEAAAIDRANAIQSFVLGTVVTGRMLHTGAVATATSAELRAWLADVLQRLLGDVSAPGPPVGNLPGPTPPRAS